MKKSGTTQNIGAKKFQAMATTGRDSANVLSATTGKRIPRQRTMPKVADAMNNESSAPIVSAAPGV